MTVNAVIVREIDAPAGEEPVEWILLATLPIDTLEQAKAVVEYYCARWNIEVFFRTLKSGCRIEERRFERVELIAQLGGYVPRKESEPGTQTVWIGMQRMYDPALAWDAFGPEAKMKGA